MACQWSWKLYYTYSTYCIVFYLFEGNKASATIEKTSKVSTFFSMMMWLLFSHVFSPWLVQLSCTPNIRGYTSLPEYLLARSPRLSFIDLWPHPRTLTSLLFSLQLYSILPWPDLWTRSSSDSSSTAALQRSVRGGTSVLDQLQARPLQLSSNGPWPNLCTRPSHRLSSRASA
jgi:hypothetical protein